MRYIYILFIPIYSLAVPDCLHSLKTFSAKSNINHVSDYYFKIFQEFASVSNLYINTVVLKNTNNNTHNLKP
jgi:hypothetical protein